MDYKIGFQDFLQLFLAKHPKEEGRMISIFREMMKLGPREVP